MSYTPSRNEQTLTLAAGQTVQIPLYCDYVYFVTITAGVLVGLNGSGLTNFLPGELHQGPPGLGIFRTITLLNPGSVTATVRFIYGMGTMSISGATLASSSSLVSAGLDTLPPATAAGQVAEQALLYALTVSATETPDFVTVAAGTNQTFTNCRSLALDNTGATDVTVTVAGNARTLPAGEGRAFEVSGPFNRLAAVNVAVPAGGACVVATTV